MASFLDSTLALLGLQRLETPGPAARHLPVERDVIVAASVAQVRAWINAHDRGSFGGTAKLATLATRDADVFGALLQRLLALSGCEVEFEPANDSAVAQRWADDLKALWPRMVSGPALADLHTSAVLMGFGTGQLVWGEDPDTQEFLPHLDPWPAEACEYRTTDRRWYAQALGCLALPITPGDGRWIHYTPRSVYTPHHWGALRAIGSWVLRAENASDDASRHAELHGIPVWVAELPAGGRQTADGKAFARSIRSMGRNAVVPCPQGNDKASSYNVRLESAETDAYRIFEFLTRRAAGKFRLALLGQDLTSQNEQVGTNASSSTGRAVTSDVLVADGTTRDDTLFAQLVQPWARYRGRPDLAPRPRTRVRPPEDLAVVASGLSGFGAALSALRPALAGEGLELTPDTVRRLAARFGLAVRALPQAPPPALKPTVPPQEAP